MEKLTFLCSCAIDSIKAGGSVLIPIGRLGIILQLLEQISDSLTSSNIKMCSGDPLFGHVELLKDKRLQMFPAGHLLELLKSWKEPCIVFCPHWNLRLGSVVHLLARWCGDPNSLLILENMLILALLPFKPMTIKVLQCSFLSGIKLQKVQPLLNILQPKVVVLFPENSRRYIPTLNTSISLNYFSRRETLRIPKLKTNSELDIATDLTLQIDWKKLKDRGVSIARLEEQLLMEHGRHRLLPENEHVVSRQTRSLLHGGKINLKNMLTSLEDMSINGSVEQRNIDSGSLALVHILETTKALIEMKATTTVISTDDEGLASLITKAISSSLDGI